MPFVRWLFFAAGLLLFVLILHHAGLRQVRDDVLGQGWAIVPYLALSALEGALHASSCRRCVSPEHRDALPWWRMFLLYHLAYAVNTVTPTGDVGGDVARGVALRRYVPGSEAASCVVINKFTFSIARIAVAAALTAMTVLVFPLSPGSACLIGLGSALLILALLLFAAFQARGLFGPTLAALARVAGPARQAWVREHVGELDRRLQACYRHRRGDLLASMGYDALGFGVGVLQRTFLMAVLIGSAEPAARVTLAAGAAVWGISNVVDMIFFFVAGRLGVHEGGTRMAFEAVGFSGEKGVALSMVDRIDQLVWTALGLSIYWVYLVRGRRPARAPEPCRTDASARRPEVYEEAGRSETP